MLTVIIFAITYDMIDIMIVTMKVQQNEGGTDTLITLR